MINQKAYEKSPQVMKEKIARRLAAWINASGLDQRFEASDWWLAEQIMNRKLPRTDHGCDVQLPSITELLDGAESEM